MNDEQMRPLLEVWLRDRQIPPPRVQAGVAKVMTHLPQTRQQGRWLPLPMHRPEVQTPTATDTTDYQPSPTTATNGHSPTVIGRTQPMLSPAKAITAGAIVFALGGVFLIAQPFQQQGSIPGAEGGAASPPVEFSGVIICGNPVRTGTTDWSSWDEGRTWRAQRGDAWRQTFTMSDPRLEGDVYQSNDADVYSSPGSEGIEATSLEWSTYRIENDAGAWQGSAVSFNLPDEPDTFEPGNRLTYVLIGEGGYEGLTAIFDSVPNAEYRPCGSDAYGLIFEGDPALPEPFVVE